MTVYNKQFGVVKDVRTVKLLEGLNIVRFSDVAERIDPTSVAIRSLSAPNSLTVREQNYEYELATPANILEKSVGRPLKFRQFFSNGSSLEVSGTLLNNPRYSWWEQLNLSAQGPSKLAVGTAHGIVLNPTGQIEMIDLPPGLVTKPTLTCLLRSRTRGDNEVEVAYETAGLNWRADYVAVMGPRDDTLNLTSWVTLDNKSGATYNDASLKLIAGDVHRVKSGRYNNWWDRDRDTNFLHVEPTVLGFTSSAFAEYQMYALHGKTTVRDNETKQLSLFSADQIPANKTFVYEPNQNRVLYGGGDQSKKVNVKIEVENSQKNNLGMAMPAGKVRVYKKDADGALQFVGEDNIDHTPKDEKLRLYIGDAFDLVGERNIMKSDNVSDHIRRETVQVKLRNHKDTAVTIVVVEHPYGDWVMMNNSAPFKKESSTKIEFPIKVPANGESTLDYQIEYHS